MTQFAHPQGTFDAAKGRYVDAAGLPAIAQPDILPLIALVFVQILYVTMVYGPIAAFLVEYFPARIRYTACRSRTTSGTAGSAGSCRSSRPRSSRPPATSSRR